MGDRSNAVLAPSRHPFQLFILSLCLVSGIPVLFGKAPAPGSMEDTLPPLLLFGWSLMMVLGSAVALAGTFWKNRITGILIEQVGLVSVGVSALLYGFVVLVVAWDNGGQSAAAIVLGFGISCIVRWWQLQLYIKSVALIVECHGEL